MVRTEVKSIQPTTHVTYYSVRKRLISQVLCIAFMCAPIATNASGLTSEQTGHALFLSTQAPWSQPRTQIAQHPLGVQTLSIEKQERKNQYDSRWINVYQYNYALQSARLLLVDLQSDTIVRQSSINSVHLPLNDTEIEFSKSLLGDKQELIDRLKLEQTRRGASRFNLLAELDVKVSIYEPRDTAHACYRQRCALVSLFDDTRTVFTTEPVINLTTLQVETLGRP